MKTASSFRIWKALRCTKRFQNRKAVCLRGTQSQGAKSTSNSSNASHARARWLIQFQEKTWPHKGGPWAAGWRRRGKVSPSGNYRMILSQALWLQKHGRHSWNNSINWFPSLPGKVTIDFKCCHNSSPYYTWFCVSDGTSLTKLSSLSFTRPCTCGGQDKKSTWV